MELNNENKVAGLVMRLSSSNLDTESQEELINKIVNENRIKEEDSLMDKIFGKRNPQMYVALVMSIIVLGIVTLFTCLFRSNLEFVKFVWNIAIPAVTLLWGYAFGKSQTK